MATKAEITDRVARRLAEVLVDSLTWAQLVLAVQGMSTEEKAALVLACRERRAAGIGEQMREAVRVWARAQAQADAQTMLSDDLLSLEDLDKLLRE